MEEFHTYLYISQIVNSTVINYFHYIILNNSEFKILSKIYALGVFWLTLKDGMTKI